MRRDGSHKERTDSQYVIRNLRNIRPAYASILLNLAHKRYDSVFRESAAACCVQGAPPDKVFHLFLIG